MAPRERVLQTNPATLRSSSLRLFAVSGWDVLVRDDSTLRQFTRRAHHLIARKPEQCRGVACCVVYDHIWRYSAGIDTRLPSSVFRLPSSVFLFRARARARSGSGSRIPKRARARARGPRTKTEERKTADERRQTADDRRAARRLRYSSPSCSGDCFAGDDVLPAVLEHALLTLERRLDGSDTPAVRIGSRAEGGHGHGHGHGSEQVRTVAVAGSPGKKSARRASAVGSRVP